MTKTALNKLKSGFRLRNFCTFSGMSGKELLSDFIREKTLEMVDVLNSYLDRDDDAVAELSIFIPHTIEDDIPLDAVKYVKEELYRLWHEASYFWMLVAGSQKDCYPDMYHRIEFEKTFHAYQRSEAVFWDALLSLASDDDELYRSTMSELNMRISNLSRVFCIPLGDLVMIKLKALYEREGESEEWRRTLSVNSICPEVLDYKYEHYLEAGDAEKAAAALSVILMNRKEERGGAVPEIHLQLLKLQREAGLVEDEKREIMHILFYFEQEDLTHYLRFKEIADDEEFEYLNEILDRSITFGLKDQILAYEGKHEELLEYLKREGSIEYLRRNAEYLASVDPDGFWSLCEGLLGKVEAVARGRNEYWFIAEILDVMRMVDPERAGMTAVDVMKRNSRKRALRQMILDKGFKPAEH